MATPVSTKDLKELLDQVLNQLKDLKDLKNLIEISSAKVINEISEKMDKCECSKEILQAIKDKPETVKIPEKQPSKKTEKPRTKEKFKKYSWPHVFVGNEEFGDYKEPGAIELPMDKESTSKGSIFKS